MDHTSRPAVAGGVQLGLKLERIVSKRGDAPYAPGNRGLWLKVKCLNREGLAGARSIGYGLRLLRLQPFEDRLQRLGLRR